MNEIRTFLETILIVISGHEITVAQILIIPLVLLTGYLILGWLIRFTVNTMLARGVNADVVQMVRRALFVTGLIILVITALDLLNVPLTAFAFVSGAVAIGFGFGAQNIINNFISGWILMWERPIRINDFIEVGETTGTVEEINTRSTRIRRVDGVHLLVPNSQLLEQTVVNWTLVDKLLRCIVRIGVVYGADVEKVKELLLKVANDHPLVLDDPEPVVYFEDFGDNALIFDAYFWVHSQGEKSGRKIRSEFRFEVNRLFNENGLVIAFPQRDIHLDGTLTIAKPD
jgi:small-conductance mechanosensitive channel